MELVKSTRNQMLLIATALLWIATYAAYTADWMIGGMMPFAAERALRRIPICLFGAICCWGIKLLLDRSASQRVVGRVGTAFGLCLLASLAYAAVNTLVFYIIHPIWGGVTFIDAFEPSLTVSFVYFAWTALYFAIDAEAKARDARLRLADAQTEALRARNQALAQQISPHFLFNALNTVSGLIIEGEPARAERVTIALAALLRRSLETDAQDFVSLGE
jgi:hypothetical protein